MGAIITFLIVVALSLLITQIGAVALVHTGLSKASAKFQARSAFTGVGYTTKESEQVTDHAVRRKIILTLMLLGNAGIVSAISSLILTFTNKEDAFDNHLISLGIIVVMVLLIWFVFRSKLFNKLIQKPINWALKKYTDIRVIDYSSFLNIDYNYELDQIKISSDNWLSNKTLEESKLRQEGIFVLGIQREDGNYLGVPTGETKIKTGDLLKLYGREKAIEQLKDRKPNKSGDQEHEEASEEQSKVKNKEKTADNS